MHVSAGKPCGVRTAEVMPANSFVRRLWHCRARRRAQIHRTGHEVSQQDLAQLEGLSIPGNNLCRIRRMGMRVYRSDKETSGTRGWISNPTEGPGFQSSPLARIDKLPLYGVWAKRFSVLKRILIKNLSLIFVDLDDDGLKRPLRATIDGGNPPASRRGVFDALTFFIGEEQLTAFDAISDLHCHGRLHPLIVRPQQGHRSRAQGGIQLLRGRSGQGYVQTTLDLYHVAAHLHCRVIRQAHQCPHRARETPFGGGADTVTIGELPQTVVHVLQTGGS